MTYQRLAFSGPHSKISRLLHDFSAPKSLFRTFQGLKNKKINFRCTGSSATAEIARDGRHYAVPSHSSNVKRNLHHKLKVSNAEINSTCKCVNLVTLANFTAHHTHERRPPFLPSFFLMPSP